MDQNTESQSYLEELRHKKVRRIYLIITICLFAAVLVLGFIYLRQRSKSNQLMTEKQQLLNKQKKLSASFDSLKTRQNKLQKQISQRKQQVTQLTRRITEIKTSTQESVETYKEELSVLKNLLDTYVQDVDSLEKENQQLTANYQQTKDSLTRVKQELDEAQKLNNSLSQKIQDASILNAGNIEASGVNKRGKVKFNIGQFEKLRVCFTLQQNLLIESGSKTIYARIVRPDSVLLTESKNNVFTYQEEQMVFSEKRKVYYENEDLDVCIYYDIMNNKNIIEGTYTIELYNETHKLGTAKMTLKTGVFRFI